MSLTNRQTLVLDTIRRLHDEQGGKGPSVRQLAHAMNFSSSNGAYYYIELLREAGYITRDEHGAIGSVVPEGVVPTPIP